MQAKWKEWFEKSNSVSVHERGHFFRPRGRARYTHHLFSEPFYINLITNTITAKGR